MSFQLKPNAVITELQNENSALLVIRVLLDLAIELHPSIKKTLITKLEYYLHKDLENS